MPVETGADSREPLRVLILEDVPTDAELALRELRKTGMEFVSKRVETREQFERAIHEFKPDLILSDFSLPASFDGLAALDIARKALPDIPFVFVSGTIGEDRAVEAMKRGATDYVLKDRLSRLIPVIMRALEEARERAARRRAEQRIARLNRMQVMLSGINTTIVRVADRDALFRAACRIAVEDGGFALAWIGVLDPKTLEVKPTIWQGQHESLLETPRASLREGAPNSQGTTAAALRSGRPVVVNDIANDPRVRKAAALLERGLRALIALPLLVDGEPFGVFKLYAAEAGIFDQEELKLLEDLAGDISFALDHIAKAERLDYLAYYDGLTGVPNRKLFHEHVARFIHSAASGEQGVAVVALDLERFRNINETLGMAAGDVVLKQFAERLSSAVGEPGTVARISADRFAVALVPMRNETEIAHVLDNRIFAAFSAAFSVNGEALRIPMKAGVAVYPGDGADAATLFVNAEAALAKAKQSGERYLFYASQMNARVAEQLRLENELRAAVLQEQFILYYQPRIDLTSSRICGMEALIRWRHPERGLVSPAEFIPVLEQTGMILDVGRWVLKRARFDYAAWNARGLEPPRIAVNVSQAQLRRKEFVEDVRSALTAAGGHGDRIDIEITESMLMEDIEDNIEKLRAVRALGIGVALDDFGTGYSSLNWLARLPIDSLKIDRSFIMAMAESAEHMAIVSAVISLARALHLKVVAEGVETQEQSNLLRLLRCDEAQGYLFHPPLPPEKVELLFASPRP